jgi:predicted TIM-barrel fold metal-dependent hydrolase
MGKNRIDRRSLLLLGMAAGLGGCSWAAPRPPLPPVPPPGGLVAFDIHCHVFNAADLPIRGFLDDIYISASPGLLRYSEEGLVAFVSTIMKGQAIAAEQEAAEINGTAVRLLATDRFSRDYSRTTNAELLRQSVSAAAAELQNDVDVLQRGGTVRSPFAIQDVARQVRGRQQILRDLAAETRNPMNAFVEGRAPSAAAVADGAVNAFLSGSGPQALVGVLWMATLLTRRRRELVERLFDLPETNGTDVRILAPAIIDYSYWLDDFNSSPLQDQIDVMSAIAAHPPSGRAVHSWVSFCPWRQLRESAQAGLVKTAILERGMLGVKLYPVMGFYPIGNEQAQARGERYPCNLESIPNFGKRMDDALRDIYQFCVDNDVPLLAHCSDSEYPYLFDCAQRPLAPKDALGLRGAPTIWAQVLQDYPRLRLNIGHAGGLWDLSAHPDPNRPIPSRPWTPEVIQLISSAPSAYADIADYSSVYDRDQTDDLHILGVVNQSLNAYPGARDKLMYGTDWVMLSMALHAERYYPEMRRLLPSQLGLNAAQTSGFFGGNAARMTGISIKSGVKPQTRQRLEAFYDRHGLDKAVLARFDN